MAHGDRVTWAELLKSDRSPTDQGGVFRSARPIASEARDELVRLGTAHITFQIDDGWLVVGPTGLFVVSTATGDLATAADDVCTRAGEIRKRLANDLSFVPFVDAVLVTDERLPGGALPCMAIDPSNLRTTIAEGPRTIDDETLGRLGLLALQRLA